VAGTTAVKGRAKRPGDEQYDTQAQAVTTKKVEYCTRRTTKMPLLWRLLVFAVSALRAALIKLDTFDECLEL
jgi:hypothetical protein